MDGTFSLTRIADRARRAGLHALLDADLSASAEELLLLLPAPDLLGAMVAETGCSTLGALVLDPRAAAVLEATSPAADAFAFVAGLATWIDALAAAAEAGLGDGTTLAPLPPAGYGELFGWVSAHGVLNHLAISWPVLSPRLTGEAYTAAKLGAGTPLYKLFEPQALVEPRSRRRGRHRGPLYDFERFDPTSELVEAARAHLRDAARVCAFERCRLARLPERQPPSEPALRRLIERIDACFGPSRGLRDGRDAGASIARHIAVDLERRRFVYQESISPRANAARVEVQVELEREPLGLHCSCIYGQSADGRCEHAAAALKRLKEVVEVPNHFARGDIVTALDTPEWEHFLRDLDAAVRQRAAPSGTQARLAFRVFVSAGQRVAIEAVLERPSGRGFRAGVRVGYQCIEEAVLVAAPEDEQVLDVLGGPRQGIYSLVTGQIPRRALVRALEALRDHPRVYAGRKKQDPARIERHPLRLELEPAGDGLRPVFHLGPLRRDALAVAGALEGAHLVDFDEAAGLCVLSDVDPPTAALVATLARRPVAFPPESHDAVLGRLAALTPALELSLPPELEGEQRAGRSEPLARVTRDGSGGADLQILARPMEGGATFSPGAGSPRLLQVRAGRRCVVTRDLTAEGAAARALLADLGREGSSGFRFEVADDDALLDALAALRARGVAVEWADDDARLELASPASRGQLRLRVEERRDWFGVEGSVTIDGESVSLVDLLRTVKAGRRYVRLGPKRFAAIEEALRARLAAASDVLFEGRRGIEVAAGGATATAELVDDPGRLDAAEGFRDLVRRIDRSRELEPRLPAGLRAELRPYQLDGFRWMARLASWGAGACLADDMGLGKTVQALAVLLARASRGPALVVAPTSVGPNWMAEAARFAPGLRVRAYRGADRAALLGGLRKKDVLVTSYALAARDAEALSSVRFATLVLDEAQALKNALTAAVRDLRRHAPEPGGRRRRADLRARAGDARVPRSR